MSEKPHAPDAPLHAPVPKYLVPAFVAGLIAWGLYLGIGAAFPERAPADRTTNVERWEIRKGSMVERKEAKVSEMENRADWQNFRPWRGVVVIACSALFLAWFWGLQRLYVRRQKR